MFVYKDKTRQYWFNANSFEANIQFELVGTVIGLAVYNGVILDIHFPSVVYKMLTQTNSTNEDLKEVDPVSQSLFSSNSLLPKVF